MSRLDLSTEDQAEYSRLIAAYRTAAQAAIATARGALDLSEHHAAMQCGVALGKVDNLISNINMQEMMSQQNRDDAVSSNMGTSALVLPLEDQRLLEELGDQFAQYKAAKEALDTFHKSKAALRAISNNAQDAYLLQQNETYRHITEAKTVLRPLNAIPRTNDEELLIEHLKSCVLYPDRCVELNLELATAEDQAAGIQADYIHQWVTEQDFQDEYDACVTAWDGEFRDLANRTKFLQLLANYSLATEGGGVNYNGSADTQTPNIQSALNAIASVDPENRQRLLDLSNLMQDFYKKHIKNSKDTAALFRCHLNAARDTLNACINDSGEPLNIANHYHHYIQRVTQGLSTINQQEAREGQRQARATAHANAHTQLDYLNLRLQLSNDLQHHHIPASELHRSQTLLQQPFYHRSSQDTIRQEIQEIQYTTAISHLTAASQPTLDQHGAEIRNPLKTIGRSILRDTRAAAELDPTEKPALTRVLRSTTAIINNPTKPEAIANVARASRSIKNKKIKKHKAKTIWGRIGFGLAAAASFAFAGACAVGIALTGGLLAIPLGAGVIAGVSAGIIASEKAGNYEADAPLPKNIKRLTKQAKQIDNIIKKHTRTRRPISLAKTVKLLRQKKHSYETIATALMSLKTPAADGEASTSRLSTEDIARALTDNEVSAVDIARALAANEVSTEDIARALTDNEVSAVDIARALAANHVSAEEIARVTLNLSFPIRASSDASPYDNIEEKIRGMKTLLNTAFPDLRTPDQPDEGRHDKAIAKALFDQAEQANTTGLLAAALPSTRYYLTAKFSVTNLIEKVYQESSEALPSEQIIRALRQPPNTDHSILSYLRDGGKLNEADLFRAFLHIYLAETNNNLAEAIQRFHKDTSGSRGTGIIATSIPLARQGMLLSTISKHLADQFTGEPKDLFTYLGSSLLALEFNKEEIDLHIGRLMTRLKDPATMISDAGDTERQAVISRAVSALTQSGKPTLTILVELIHQKTITEEEATNELVSRSRRVHERMDPNKKGMARHGTPENPTRAPAVISPEEALSIITKALETYNTPDQRTRDAAEAEARHLQRLLDATPSKSSLKSGGRKGKSVRFSEASDSDVLGYLQPVDRTKAARHADLEQKQDDTHSTGSGASKDTLDDQRRAACSAHAAGRRGMFAHNDTAGSSAAVKSTHAELLQQLIGDADTNPTSDRQLRDILTQVKDTCEMTKEQAKKFLVQAYPDDVTGGEISERLEEALNRHYPDPDPQLKL